MKKWMVSGLMIVALAMLTGCPTIDQSLVGSWNGVTEVQANAQPAQLNQIWQFTTDGNIVMTAGDQTWTDMYSIVSVQTAQQNGQLDLTAPTGADDQMETLQCIYAVDSTVTPATLTLAVGINPDGTPAARPADFTVSDNVDVLTFTAQ